MLKLPVTCLVTDRKRCRGRPLEDVVQAAVDGGITMVQLREKDLPASTLLPLAESMREITTGRALLFINDRVNVALAVGADGVQLPGQGMPVADVRRAAGDRLLIGRSVHKVNEGVTAENEGADLLIVGTVFSSESHPATAPQGVGILSRLREAVEVPFLAIGGVSEENAHMAIESGAVGVAVISAITESDDPTEAARRLVDATEQASTPFQPTTVARPT